MYWTLKPGPDRVAAKAEYERQYPLDDTATYLIKSYFDKACMIRLKGFRGEFVGNKLYLVSPSGHREFIPRDLQPFLFKLTVEHVNKKAARGTREIGEAIHTPNPTAPIESGDSSAKERA